MYVLITILLKTWGVLSADFSSSYFMRLSNLHFSALYPYASPDYQFCLLNSGTTPGSINPRTLKALHCSPETLQAVRQGNCRVHLVCCSYLWDYYALLPDVHCFTNHCFTYSACYFSCFMCNDKAGLCYYILIWSRSLTSINSNNL